MATMLDRGRRLSLWGSLWKAIQPLRPAFSNAITFMWFATVVAGMIVRVDLLGVTSIVRALNLRPELYHALLRLRIPMKPARHSNMKPATRYDLKPAMVTI